MERKDQPYIPANQTLPEITVKGVILGILLSAILAAANAYLGLFAGMTVSASIPAAVISMAILRLFKKSNILENNAVQTAASAGESLAAGVIFTFPALVLMGYWDDFNYWQTTFIALCGGILGVFFTIPLRSALIVREKLKFPEGVATAEVLKTGTDGGKFIKFLVWGGLIGAVVKLIESGLKLWKGSLEMAHLAGDKLYGYFGLNASPALVAVGYIVGLRIAALVFIGGVISWWVAIPLYIAFSGEAFTGDPVAIGGKIWNEKIRYLGAGAMLIGGLWALVSIRKSLGVALRSGLDAFQTKKDSASILRTDLDTPMKWVMLGIILMILPIFYIYFSETEIFGVSLFMAVLMVIAGFLFSAVAGYMAGLVGSSNNPISGVTIATILTASLLLLLFMGTGSAKGPAAAILIGAVVCCAAAIAGDNMQDLKAGNVLGATPRKQQFMQIVGVTSAALVMAPVLSQLNNAYGFGPKTLEHPDSLTAPQATLMQSVAEGVFGGNLPWTMIIIGIFLGIFIIMADIYQERRGSSFRIPVLAVAVGLYLPFELDSAIMLGGVIAWLVSRYQAGKQGGRSKEAHQAAVHNSGQAGLLFASGLITGEALLGIGLAIPVGYTGDPNIMAMLSEPMGAWLGVLVVLLICGGLYSIAKRGYEM